MYRIPSYLIKSITVMCLSLGAVAGLSAAKPAVTKPAAIQPAVGPALSVTITGTLGPILGGSGGVVSGTYQSGITSASGPSGSSCKVNITGTGGSGATATILIGGLNLPPTAGTILQMQTAGSGYSLSSPPTSATPTTGGTATCTGTAVITTKVDDPLGLNGTAFTATTSLNPVGVVYNPSSIVYPNLTLSFKAGILTLPCTATGTLTINDSTDGGNDTFAITGCNFVSIVNAAFTAKVAFPAGTIVAPIPLAFNANLVTSPVTASQGTYTITSAGSDQGVSTTMGIGGNVATVCSGCPTETFNPSSLSFTAQAGGSAPPAQTVTTGSSPTENEAFAFTVATSSGGNWLSANDNGAAGGQLGGNVSVSVNPSGLSASPTPYSGTITVYSAATNSPTTIPVSFTVSAAPFSLQPSPASFTFGSVNGATPSTQLLSVKSSTGSAVPFTDSASSTGNWLSVNPTSGTTGVTNVTVGASPSGVPAGANSGNITVTSTGATNSPLSIPVTFNETTIPAPSALNFNATLGGSNPANQQLNVIATAGPNVTYTATVASGSWLSVSTGIFTTGSGSFPAVSVNIAGLAAGPYTGTIDINPTGGNPIPVTVNLTITSLPSMVPNPTSLTFAFNPSSFPSSQNIGITSSSSTAISYTVTANTASGGNWLSAAPSSGATPGTETVSIVTGVAGSLATGTYTGNVVFTCTTGTCGNTSGTLSVPVTLKVTATLSPTPTAVIFTYTIDGSFPGSQQIQLASNGGAIAYTDTFTTSTGGNWLSATPAGGTTPSSLTASVNTSVLTGLTAGTYNGSISVSSAGATNSPVSIPVSLVVSPAPTLILSTGSLTFNMVDLGSLPSSQGVSVSASGGAAVSFTTSVTQGAAWLSASPSSGTTPGTITVSILANSLTAGQYTGTVQVSSTSVSNSPQSITVTLNVSPAPTLISSANSFTFAYQTPGGSIPASQPLTITGSSGAALTFTSAASTTSGGSWLAVTSPTGPTPQNLTVSVVGAVVSGLAVGTYNGSITITSSQASNSPLTIPVTLTVSSQASLTTAPSSLSFTYTLGGTVPGLQTVNVGSTGTGFTGVTATSPASWITVSPSGSSTPLTLTVSPVVTGLTAGTYNTNITITASGAGNSPLLYPVSLTVSAQPTLSVTPTPLTFTGLVGGTNPANQTLNVNGANGAIGFTAAAATTSGGNWLSVSPTSGTTNTSLQVSVNTSGLAANTYQGSITVTSTTSGVAGSPAVIPVTLTLNANSLTATPSPLNFTYTIAGSAPSAQTLNVGSTIAGLSFTAAPGASWIHVSPGSGSTPLGVAVSVVTTGLTAGPYSSNVTITASGAGNSPLVVPVNLTVNAEPSLTALPTTLSFNYTAGAAAPPGQSVAVSTSNSSSVAYSLSASTTGGGNWLQFSPSGGTAPSSFVASIVPGNIAAGTYHGTITISAAGYNSATVAVTVVVTQPKAVIQITGGTLFVLANTAAPATNTLSVSSSDGSAQAFTIAAGPSQNNWLTLSPSSGTTPANVTATANPAGLIPGIYVIPVTVTMPALPISTKTIQMQLTVTGSNLAASPSMLTFTYQPGAPLPPAQKVSLTTASGTGTVALASVTTDVGWLSVTPASSAPATLTVSINPGLLTAGTYEGDVIIKGVGSPDTSLQIPVTITITSLPQLTATPAAISFSYQIGGAVPAAQSFAVAAGSAKLSFTATSPGNWLTLSPSSGTTPASVLVTLNPTGLGAGTYTGTIGVTAVGAANSAVVAVSLTVAGQPQVTVAPSQLFFAYPMGGATPLPQTLTVASLGGALSFTAQSNSAWLGVTPSSGTTPATVAVSVNPAGLTVGIYSGTIGITPANGATTVVPVTLQVGSGGPTPVLLGVINAASGAIGKVAPGMAISIFGSSLGPQTGVGFAAPAPDGTVATTLGGTEVLFDGIPAPILFTLNGQVNALVPFELSSKISPASNTVLKVVYNGETSAGMSLPVVAAEPGMFTEDGTGKGQGSILNQDGTVNSASIPAAAGSVIQLFGTGGGVTNPASIDGALNPISSTGKLTETVSATVGGQPATVSYSGPAPGLVSGIIQINLTIPAGTPSGNAPVVVTVGTAASQTVTVAVK